MKGYEQARDILREAMEDGDDAIDIFDGCETAQQVVEVGLALLRTELNANLRGKFGYYIANIAEAMCLESLDKPYSKHDNQGDIDDRCDSINENFKAMNDE